MSSVVISGNTSGTITLDAPAVAGTTTLTLPATTGTLSLTASPTFTGQATIPTINLTGGQITFPATQSASADANTLDDYEEGTWTPSIIGSTTAGTGTYTTQQGTYTKIGNIVKFQAEIVWTAHTGTGQVQVANYPFTSTAETSPISITLYGGSTFTSGNFIQAYKNPSNTNSGTAQTSSASVFSSVSISNAGTYIANGVYKVA
jgi:hypothetical protein